MLHHDKRHAGMVRHSLKEAFEGLQAARGGADAHHITWGGRKLWLPLTVGIDMRIVGDFLRAHGQSSRIPWDPRLFAGRPLSPGAWLHRDAIAVPFTQTQVGQDFARPKLLFTRPALKILRRSILNMAQFFIIFCDQIEPRM